MSNCAFESHRNAHGPTYKFLLFVYMWGIIIKYLQFGIYFSPHTAVFDSKCSIWAGVKITALKAAILMVQLVPETENRCLKCSSHCRWHQLLTAVLRDEHSPWRTNVPQQYLLEKSSNKRKQKGKMRWGLFNERVNKKQYLTSKLCYFSLVVERGFISNSELLQFVQQRKTKAKLKLEKRITGSACETHTCLHPANLFCSTEVHLPACLCKLCFLLITQCLIAGTCLSSHSAHQRQKRVTTVQRRLFYNQQLWCQARTLSPSVANQSRVHL